METLLVISVLGQDRPGIVDELSKGILDCDCAINETRMAVLGDEFAMLAMLSGNWNGIAKIEALLPKLAAKLDLSLQMRRTKGRPDATNVIPYGVEVVSIDHTGIVHDVAEFFSRRGMNIEDMFTSVYRAPHTGTPMFSLHMTIAIPADSSIAALRGEFMDFCDDLNLDAIMAPVK